MNYHLTNLRRNKTVLKLARNANTDVIVNCLLQPGHIRNQLFTSMPENSTYLLNSVHLDSSVYRDKVSRAVGQRAVGSVFCSQFIKCTVTSKWRFHYRDSYVREFYRDQTTCVRLPGLAKNSPTLTLSATQLYHRAVIKNAAGLPVYSASHSASNKMHNIMTGFQHLSAFTTTRKCPAEFPLPTRV